MEKIKNFFTPLHNKTKRKYLERMVNDKINCMKEAKKYSSNYWDGDRKYGYGGYKYIEGYFTELAIQLIDNYNLSEVSSILDIGCGKGFLLYEIKKILPKINIHGIDISNYAIENSKPEIKEFLSIHNIVNKTTFLDNQFDLTISIGCLHNLEIYDLYNSITEINRISKNSYILVESYRNDKELFNLQCWALTCNSFFSVNEWKWIYNSLDYKGDYEFIYFE